MYLNIQIFSFISQLFIACKQGHFNCCDFKVPGFVCDSFKKFRFVVKCWNFFNLYPSCEFKNDKLLSPYKRFNLFFLTRS